MLQCQHLPCRRIPLEAANENVAVEPGRYTRILTLLLATLMLLIGYLAALESFGAIPLILLQWAVVLGTRTSSSCCRCDRTTLRIHSQPLRRVGDIVVRLRDFRVTSLRGMNQQALAVMLA